MFVSPQAYDIMRESNVITLPSRRSLRDYTNWYKAKAGYQVEVFDQLRKYIKIDKLNEAQKYMYAI